MRNWIKRTAGLLALLFLAAAVTAGCARRPETTEDGRLKVVTTLFPYYDFVRQVAGDRVNLTLVVPAGMDSHSFEPTPADMITIQEADVLICNGGEMEHWLSQVLDSIDKSHMKIVTMMDYVDAVEEEHVEGMEDAEHEHADHEHADEDDDGHGVEIEYDEHIWTSPVNAMAIVKIINQTLDEALPGEAGRFDENTRAYLGELEELDGEFRQVVAQGKRHMIIVADKFPFRYFADEYGLPGGLFRVQQRHGAQRQNHRLPDRQDQGGADSGGLLSGTVQPQHRQGDRGGNGSQTDAPSLLPQRDQAGGRPGHHLPSADEAERGGAAGGA